MGSVKASEIPEEKAFMADLWEFRKKYYIPEQSDEYNAEVFNAFLELGDKYGGSQYMKDVLIAAYKDYDERSRSMRKGGKHDAIRGCNSR